MTKITFITFGKIKSEPIKELIEYYLMLLGKYSKTEYRVLRDVDGRKVEASDLNSSFRDLGYTIAVSEQGTDFTTEGFKFFVDKRFRYENNITFIFGNAFGLDPEFLQKCDYSIALSKLTFTHELAIVLMIEQLYRVLNITSGGSYHK
ncbi:23S rRNA (pseudouridine(1915)-N(3))-methyltransferase RlmH [Candidatus Dojkabacteria bacterium]|uniref:Ribosomal RNA large subunit methyltransferase H n=1 Tax=Candidatus Dojkabacteria bacterium TaxID=2099670 RepID=A0A955I9P8_9BACT|nr:23S rRNA (pseudouridine(1915)-N(3))-methyltransferase RlmH [Candidatus Dojkabacteria bacterium]